MTSTRSEDMRLNVLFRIFFLLNFLPVAFWAQGIPEVARTADSIRGEDFRSENKGNPLSYRKLILPAVFIVYGGVSLGSDDLKKLNVTIREKVLEHHPRSTKVDNLTPLAPGALVYVLNLAGVPGKHNFSDRTLIYGTSLGLASALVFPLKYLTREVRPDGSNHNSFPSGHTAIAFASAQFMFREYEGRNLWLALSGYPFAVFTGVYRVMNDRHWFGDVVAGAGFGILSTELAYWLQPYIKKIFGKKGKYYSTLTPVYFNKSFGLGFSSTF